MQTGCASRPGEQGSGGRLDRQSAAAPTLAPTIQFSVDDLPDFGRSGAVRDYLTEMMRVEVAALDRDVPIQYRAELRMLPGVSFGTAFASGMSTHRTGQLLKDSEDDLMLVMPDTRMTIQMPNRDDIVIEPGDAAVVSQAREMRLIHHDAAQSWAMRVPHRDMAQMLTRLESAPAMALRQGTPMLSMLRRYGHALEADEGVSTPSSQQVVARQMQELMAVAIAQSSDYLRHSEETAISAVRLKTARSDIEDNIGNARLSLEWIAARQQITPRHLQRLFANEGTSFSDVVRQVRLARARSMLEDPRNAHLSVAAIAHECGFSEAPNMNRAFRQHFGLRPSDVRWQP